MKGRERRQNEPLKVGSITRTKHLSAQYKNIIYPTLFVLIPEDFEYHYPLIACSPVFNAYQNDIDHL